MNELGFPFGQSLRISAVPLAQRQDFHLGAATIRPSLRTVEGPGGSAKGEPRVIQVLLALADAKGRVLSRDDLLQLAWDGRIVGDDAINRAVAEVRRIAAATQAGFEVETVPRVGYRLAGIDWTPPAPPSAGPTGGIDRRGWLIGGTALAAALAGGAALLRSRAERTTDALIARGRALAATGEKRNENHAAALFRQAIARDADRADAWGWLARVASDEDTGRDAAMRALALDPREANARATLALQRRDLDDWMKYERELRGIVKDAPDCASAWAQLTFFYQGMGRCRDSLGCNERVIAIEPFNPSHHARRALKHWIFGQVDKADQVANRALQLWPRNGTVWNARMVLYAYTNRPQAALALVDDKASHPPQLGDQDIRTWRASLAAIASRAAADLKRAVDANLAAASRAPGLAANAIMTFSYLGLIDEAYRVADGLMTNRGPVVQQSRMALAQSLYAGRVWGRSQFLFIPAAAPLRADPRFPDLCRRMGHVAYWRASGIWPDPFVRGALDPAKLA